MNPDDPLLKILACPLDKGPLHLLVPDESLGSEAALYNPACNAVTRSWTASRNCCRPPASR